MKAIAFSNSLGIITEIHFVALASNYNKLANIVELAKQRADFITLSHIVDPIRGLKTQAAKTKQSIAKNTNANSTLLDMVIAIITELKTVSFFKLTSCYI